MNIDYIVDEYDGNTKVPIVNKEKTNYDAIVFVISQYGSKKIALRIKGTEKISEIRKEIGAIDGFQKNINYMKLYCDGSKLNDNDYVLQSSIRHKRRIFLMR